MTKNNFQIPNLTKLRQNIFAFSVYVACQVLLITFTNDSREIVSNCLVCLPLRLKLKIASILLLWPHNISQYVTGWGLHLHESWTECTLAWILPGQIFGFVYLNGFVLVWLKWVFSWAEIMAQRCLVFIWEGKNTISLKNYGFFTPGSSLISVQNMLEIRWEWSHFTQLSCKQWEKTDQALEQNTFQEEISSPCYTVNTLQVI